MRGLYDIFTTQIDKKGMSEMPVNQKMRRGDFKYLYSNEVTSCSKEV